MKQEYVKTIKKQLEKCNDVGLLYLICMLLNKVGVAKTLK